MKKLLILIGLIFTMVFIAGCVLPSVTVQIVNDEQLSSIDNVAINTITEVIKAKYPDKIKRFVRYCDVALVEVDDEMFEAYFNNALHLLPDEFIDDPVIRGAVKGLLDSFEINVDTGNVDLDMGALRRARMIVKNFREKLI